MSTAGESVAVPNVFSGCVNWFNSFGKPCDIKYPQITKRFFLLSINPAWEFILRKRMQFMK